MSNFKSLIKFWGQYGSLKSCFKLDTFFGQGLRIFDDLKTFLKLLYDYFAHETFTGIILLWPQVYSHKLYSVTEYISLFCYEILQV